MNITNAYQKKSVLRVITLIKKVVTIERIFEIGGNHKTAVTRQKNNKTNTHKHTQINRCMAFCFAVR